MFSSTPVISRHDLRPDVHGARAHGARGRRPKITCRWGADAIAEPTPVFDHGRVGAGAGDVLLDRDTQAVGLTRGGAPAGVAEVSHHSRADVQRREHRMPADVQTPERVGERERLDHLYGIQVGSLRLVHEVEARPHDADAIETPLRGLAHAAHRTQSLLEGEVDSHRRIGRESAVAIERRIHRARLRRIRSGHLREPTHVSVVLRQHTRAHLQQVSSRRLARRRPHGDPVPLDDLARESQPLVRARRLDRFDEVRQPAIHDAIHAAVRRRCRDRPCGAGLAREPGPIQHQVDDGILVARRDAAADIRVAGLEPLQPAGVVAGSRRAAQGRRRAIAEGRDDRTRLGERRPSNTATVDRAGGDTGTDRRAHQQGDQKDTGGRGHSHQRWMLNAYSVSPAATSTYCEPSSM